MGKPDGEEAFKLQPSDHDGVEIRVGIVGKKAIDFTENVVEAAAVAKIFDGVGKLNGEQGEVIVVEGSVFHGRYLVDR